MQESLKGWASIPGGWRSESDLVWCIMDIQSCSAAKGMIFSGTSGLRGRSGADVLSGGWTSL